MRLSGRFTVLACILQSGQGETALLENNPTMRNTLFLFSASALALSTGCSFAGGAIVGGQLFGGGDIIMEPGMPGFTGTSLVCLGSDAPLTEDEIDQGLFQVNGRVNGTFNARDIGFDDNVVPCWTEPASGGACVPATIA